MTLFQKLLLNRTRPRISNLTSQYDRIEVINPTAGNLIENAKADSPDIQRLHQHQPQTHPTNQPGQHQSRPLNLNPTRSPKT